MKFYEQHFTFHQFKHNPHKWFAALLLSPIHHAEMRYKTQYHLKFSHAKKLFVFDMLLTLSTIVLFVATMFWWLYDPTITALVHLDVTAEVTQERFRSGDEVLLRITYTNESNVTLIQPELILHTYRGFIITSSTEPYILEKDNTIRIAVASLPPGEVGKVTISGQLFSSPGEHQSFNTMLLYTQEGKQTPESDVRRLYLTTREQSLNISFDGPPQYIANTSIPVSLTVTNQQDFVFPDFYIDIQEDHGYATWDTATSSIGSIDFDEGKWYISNLNSHDKATLSGTIHISPPTGPSNFPWSFVPWISVPTVEYPLPEVQHPFTLPLATPQVKISASWDNTYVTLGDNILLTLRVENTGNTPLEHSRVTVLGKTVNLKKSMLQPGETIPVTINTLVNATNVIQATQGAVFAPSISFDANIFSLPAYTYHTLTETPPLPVGTTLSLSQSSRYYTDEGDQLGRGSLPPQVGEETTYWIFTQIHNTVGELEDISFSTTLATGAVWTGKSSVSRGGDITFNPTTGKATWYARTMNPYETVGIYFEIAVTPSASAIGTIPALTSGATVSARDPYIDNTLTTSYGSVSASLVSDSIGQSKGVRVQ
ncbi:MAG: hypothetical protein CO029_01820 [Candidatus Magasanikbacteria bacterium CG_4_9_14_0_2_um_filter_41_10]|uniref:DUF11 domain-containing protein n=1 Tax=Candidatus Magasanikbacteria bacterium CG_4_10_14_0_2_um_filter_41_31 TaxID=1974639 RepID=A0A2M7V3D3_9BACT|nr:MAG: hypothetical protein AUJ37_01170 [Candidatus Magasanikbacteria bacterium CG1_02_41_34]PIZ92993.1 MAG: hypothetical protein COX83_03010 [Candidatus Magasanikbacteria bacterium CG_4_10_14_0_2_um_filter_41_31]PJC53614.1 MAG: hypothetical protein CO029_01820 [Candidatus Magasanikbacteria bacterium CG_4_9_14_0_2_um_filter_41_10]